MKIVIDIPKEFETHFEIDRFAESLERIENDVKNRGALSGRYDRETITMLRKAFENATPLPKGHGRLIDADALLEKLGMLGVSNAYDRPSFWYGKDKKDYKVIPTKYHNGYDNALADVEKAIQELPTIEADKEGAEE